MVWMAIAVGGALGSMARHGVNVLVHGRWPIMRFPLATFVVNVVGCLIIGVLGGFTTFSTFGLDTVTLARTQSMTPAVWNVIGQVVIGLLAVQAGILLTSR